jgi:predicted RNA binding protein YcfA (HicA-like mRNA interferase family)
MKAITGREAASSLEKHGWMLARQLGSHHIY